MEVTTAAVQVLGGYGYMQAYPVERMMREGHPLTLLGGLRIASPLAASHRLGATIAKIRTWLDDAILRLAGVRALAEIHHHVVMRDGVLLSMLRWAARRK